jgi:hypothetical protein
MKAADVSSLVTLAEANALCDSLGEGLGIVVDAIMCGGTRLCHQNSSVRGAGFWVFISAIG